MIVPDSSTVLAMGTNCPGLHNAVCVLLLSFSLSFFPFTLATFIKIRGNHIELDERLPEVHAAAARPTHDVRLRRMSPAVAVGRRPGLIPGPGRILLVQIGRPSAKQLLERRARKSLCKYGKVLFFSWSGNLCVCM